MSSGRSRTRCFTTASNEGLRGTEAHVPRGAPARLNHLGMNDPGGRGEKERRSAHAATRRRSIASTTKVSRAPATWLNTRSSWRVSGQYRGNVRLPCRGMPKLPASEVGASLESWCSRCQLHSTLAEASTKPPEKDERHAMHALIVSDEQRREGGIGDRTVSRRLAHHPQVRGSWPTRCMLDSRSCEMHREGDASHHASAHF
jgi:hypothetical protein